MFATFFLLSLIRCLRLLPANDAITYVRACLNIFDVAADILCVFPALIAIRFLCLDQKKNSFRNETFCHFE